MDPAMPERPPLLIVYQTGSKHADGRPLDRVKDDDPSYPYKFHAVLARPDFLGVTYLALYGAIEEVILRADTLEALAEVRADIEKHPRIRRYEITGPDGFKVTWSKA